MWHHTKTNKDNVSVKAGMEVTSVNNRPFTVEFASKDKKTIVIMDKARSACYTLRVDGEHTMSTHVAYDNTVHEVKQTCVYRFMGIAVANGVFILESKTTVEEPIKVGDVLHVDDPVMFGADHIVKYISDTDDVMVTSTDGVSRVWNKMNSMRLKDVIYKD